MQLKNHFSQRHDHLSLPSLFPDLNKNMGNFYYSFWKKEKKSRAHNIIM